MKRLLFACIILLSLTSCRQNDDPIIDKVAEENNFKDIIWKENELYAAGFVGYFDTEAAHAFYSDYMVETLLSFFPSATEFENIHDEGDACFIIIPRNKDVEVTVRNLNTNTQINQNPRMADIIFIFTRDGETITNLEIEFKYKDEVRLLVPQLSMKDLSMVLDDDIRDLSYVVPYNFDQHFSHDLFFGSWETKYLDNEGNHQEATFDFYLADGIYQSDKDEVEFEKKSKGLYLYGAYYFESFDGFEDGVDNRYNHLLHLDFRESDAGYSKFNYIFVDEDKLILKHVGHDPLAPTEENLLYELYRKVE